VAVSSRAPAPADLHPRAFTLQRGAKVRAANPDGATALHWAVFRNALPCIEALLRAGADKDAKDTNGYQVCPSSSSTFFCCQNEVARI
jgi:hypothetical protein